MDGHDFSVLSYCQISKLGKLEGGRERWECRSITIDGEDHHNHYYHH